MYICEWSTALAFHTAFPPSRSTPWRDFLFK